MKWQDPLVLFAIFLSVDSEDPLDELRVILHIFLPKAFNGDSNAEVRLVQVVLILFAKVVLVHEDAQIQVLVGGEVQQLDEGVEHDDSSD